MVFSFLELRRNKIQNTRHSPKWDFREKEKILKILESFPLYRLKASSSKLQSKVSFQLNFQRNIFHSSRFSLMLCMLATSFSQWWRAHFNPYWIAFPRCYFSSVYCKIILIGENLIENNSLSPQIKCVLKLTCKHEKVHPTSTKACKSETVAAMREKQSAQQVARNTRFHSISHSLWNEEKLMNNVRNFKVMLKSCWKFM